MENPHQTLSIVIPTLNEAMNILELLKGLQRQKDIHVEIVLVDGGSLDNTLEIAAAFFIENNIRYQLAATPAGRAKQLNRGAELASGDELFFLHADSEIDNPNLLCTALNDLQAERLKQANPNIAGHFGLRFKRTFPGYASAYYFYESKSRLNRPDTINGDQGIMLSKRFFQSLGGFDQSLEYMEDARLARKIFTRGRWITLPGTIITSARRFETEGLKQRQILNALLCNFDHIGVQEFFREAADAYRVQDKTRTLDLKPFFSAIHGIVREAGFLRALKLWWQTGAYVAGNAWQLAYALDCRKNLANGVPPGNGPSPLLNFYDRRLQALLNSLPGRLVTTVLTLLWFYFTYWVLVLRT